MNFNVTNRLSNVSFKGTLDPKVRSHINACYRINVENYFRIAIDHERPANEQDLREELANARYIINTLDNYAQNLPNDLIVDVIKTKDMFPKVRLCVRDKKSIAIRTFYYHDADSLEDLLKCCDSINRDSLETLYRGLALNLNEQIRRLAPKENKTIMQNHYDKLIEYASKSNDKDIISDAEKSIEYCKKLYSDYDNAMALKAKYLNVTI